MADQFRPSRDLENLVFSALRGDIDESGLRQLESLLSADLRALRWYRDMVSLQVDLRIMMTARRSNQQVLAQIESKSLHRAQLPQSKAAAVAKENSWRSRPGSGSPVLGFLRGLLHVGHETPAANALMWLVMAVVCSGMVLTVFYSALLVLHGAGGHVRVEAPELAGNKKPEPLAAPPSHIPALPAPGSMSSLGTVARLIHVADCRWTIGSHSPHVGDDLEPGRKLSLLSGVAEVMFQSGVRTLLQGPATMELGSSRSAVLRHGKLTVTVLDPDAHGFAVYTPGMKYTDLGTEFGVWVAKDGTQEMQVFRGQVQAETILAPEPGTAEDDNRSPSTPAHPQPVVLTAHQAIRVAAPDRPFERIAADDKHFVRDMPGPLPFGLFGTGVGLNRGDADPHRLITSISNDPPLYAGNELGAARSAVVAEPHPFYVSGSRERAQWIAKSRALEKMPEGCRWTYRTRFDLTGLDPSTARIEGRISADDYVVEIRLNGKPMPLPAGSHDDVLCEKWIALLLDQGFVAGENTLEIVIENAGAPPGAFNVMALCVECKGSAWPLGAKKE